MDFGIGEECGVFGVYAPGQDTARLTYYGLYALQHRGQESAGIAVSDGKELTVVKDMGLVPQVFDERTLAALDGHLSIGHVRYSTTGSSEWFNAQPAFRSGGDTGFAFAHNGNLTNTADLAAGLGMLPGIEAECSSDSDIVAEMLLRQFPSTPRGDGRDLERALMNVLPDLRGAFSLTVMDDAHLYGVRDRNGFRPLVLGRLEGGGWVLASETAALDIVGAHHVEDVAPGTMICIDATGVRRVRWADADPKLCIFEFVYFARPDSELYGQNVHAARQRMGEELARQAPVDADMVMPVPESGVPAAQGFAKESDIPYGDGLVKNRYVGRTFIQPTQQLRGMGVRLKLNPLTENVRGKRVVVVDDSIVRGTTTRQLVSMLRAAGALEVHLRISSPPYRWPCFYGMDTGRKGELVAADLTVSEIGKFVGADSIGYLDLDRLIKATGAPDAGFCTACLSGEYPVPINPAEFPTPVEKQGVTALSLGV
ncbi:MAG: amidophosphoribosyltransferase [Acidimicrobiia bacterium]|jgi:amidophosphoribosyltransferase|nr:amidophosphoribosyltransferase [Acidimicrobiia bacterium]